MKKEGTAVSNRRFRSKSIGSRKKEVIFGKRVPLWNMGAIFGILTPFSNQAAFLNWEVIFELRRHFQIQDAILGFALFASASLSSVMPTIK